MASSRWTEARNNCKRYKQQFQKKTPTERVYAKLKLNDVFDLLDGASRLARAKITALRQLMSERKWELAATVHAGGRGGDAELHFNIRFTASKDQYHVRCKERKDEQVVVFDVTLKR